MIGTEQIGKVAHTVTDAMKTQPMALALLIINVMFLIMLTWVLHEVNATNRIDSAARDALFAELKKSCEVNRQQKGNSDGR